MFFYKYQVLIVFTACFLVRTVVYSIRKCGHDLCRDEQGNTTAVTCCRQFVDNTYYNTGTRKILCIVVGLLLLAVGYFVHRVLCPRSRRLTPPHNGQPPVTTSQEPLVECSAPESSMDPAPAARLPSYEECEGLPTYEETVRDGSRGRAEFSVGQTT